MYTEGPPKNEDKGTRRICNMGPDGRHDGSYIIIQINHVSHW